MMNTWVIPKSTQFCFHFRNQGSNSYYTSSQLFLHELSLKIQLEIKMYMH